MLPQLLATALHCSVQMHSGNIQMEQGRMQLRALELQLDHHNDMEDRQADLMRDLIHGLITERIEAIHTSFLNILATYAEQARGYMTQQERLVETGFKVIDPLERAHYDARLSEIDKQLNRIRADAFCLYQEMNRALLLLGTPLPPMHGDHKNTLRLP